MPLEDVEVVAPEDGVVGCVRMRSTRVLARLSDAHRRVVEQVVFEGLAASEVDGVSAANVHQITSRFRRALREELDTWMTADVDRLLQEFIAADRAGGVGRPGRVSRAGVRRRPGGARGAARRLPGPRAAPGVRPRRVLGLAGGARGGGRARPLAGRLVGHLAGLLPRLRDRARLRRAEVVSRLAAALGAGDREAKVAGYYHAMEQGTLPAAGVSDRVLEALGADRGRERCGAASRGGRDDGAACRRRAGARRSRGWRRFEAGVAARRGAGAAPVAPSATRSTSCSRAPAVKPAGGEVVGPAAARRHRAPAGG